MTVPATRSDALRSRERILRVARGQDRRTLRLNEVARQAGLGVGTVYRHFPTVHALVEALALETLHRMRAVAAEALAEPDAAKALAHFLRAALHLQLEEGGLQAVLLSPADEADYIQLALGSLSPGDLTDLEELGLVPDLGSNPASGEIDAYARENPAEGDKAIKKGKGLSWLDQWLEESRFGTLRRATGGEETRTESGTVRVEWEVMEWAPGEGEGEWGECLGKRKFQEVEGGGGLQERPRG